MGVTLALRPVKRVPAELGYLAVLKLVFLPLSVYVVLSLVGDFDPVWMHAAMLLAALPTAANVFVISQQYGVWQERASASILLITVGSIVTLPIWLYIISSGILPPDLFP
jgi:predicted permease